MEGVGLVLVLRNDDELLGVGIAISLLLLLFLSFWNKEFEFEFECDAISFFFGGGRCREVVTLRRSAFYESLFTLTNCAASVL